MGNIMFSSRDRFHDASPITFYIVRPSGSGSGSGGNAGLTTDQARGLIQQWAQAGDVTPIPADKLTNAPAGLSDTDARALIQQWAQAGDTTPIPADKLTNAPAGGLDETQVDARIDRRIITIGPTGVLGTPTAAQYNAGVIQSLGAHSYYVKRTGHNCHCLARGRMGRLGYRCA